MADAVTESNSACVEEGEERGVASKEEFLTNGGVFRVGFGLWEVGEEIANCFKSEAFSGDFGCEGMVEEFYCVVEGANLFYELDSTWK